jgi:hypothetical protein
MMTVIYRYCHSELTFCLTLSASVTGVKENITAAKAKGAGYIAKNQPEDNQGKMA